MTKKNQSSFLFILIKIILFMIILLSLTIIFLLPVYFYSSEKIIKETSTTELIESKSKVFSINNDILSTEDFIEIDINLTEGFIFLRDKNDSCKGMVVNIDPNQAYSIQQGLEEKVSFRPLSHDIISDIVDLYDINVVMVKITEIKKGAYYGRLVLEDENKISNLDIRPSDGIAIAVRKDAPIYLSKELLDTAGQKLC